MTPGPGLIVSVLAILTAGYFTWLMWERRSMPAAWPLLAFATLVVGYLVVHTALYVPGFARNAVGAAAGSEFTFGPYFRLQALLTGVGGALWFLFSLQYTGRGERLTTRTVGLLTVFWGILGGLAVVGWIADLQLRGRPLFDSMLSLGLFSMTALLIIGTFLVAETAWERNAVGIREAGLLSGGAVTFSLTSLVAGFATYPGVPPAMLLLATLQFVVAVRTYPIFDVLPVARVAGRDLLLAEMDDAVLVVDREQRIEDVNAAAQATFDISRDSVRGTGLAALLQHPLDPEAVRERDSPVRIRTEQGTTLAVTADRVTDARGRWFGYVLHCTDVTDRQRRERRLSVLHQLLTGTVQDQLSTIADRTAVLTDTPTSDASDEETATDGSDRQQPATGGSDRQQPATVGRDVQQTVTVLKSLVARTREIERELADIQVETVSVEDIVREVVTSADQHRIGMTTASQQESVTTTLDPDVLRSVLSILLDEALAQSEETVAVTVETPRHGPEIHVGFHRAAVTDSQEDDRERRTDAQHDDRERRIEMTVELLRLAVESIGATLTTVDSGPEKETVVIQLPREHGVSGAGADTLGPGTERQPQPGERDHHVTRGETR